MDFCSDTCSKVEACILPDRHGRTIRWVANCELQNGAETSVPMSPSKELATKFYISGGKRLKAAAEVLK